jgi:hypothetical protein
MVMVDDKIDDDIEMHLRWGPFLRPCGCSGAIQTALHNEASSGLLGSHWTPPSGNYSLCIAPAAARATENETMTKKWTNFAGHFDGCGDELVQYCAYHSMKKIQGFTRSHWTPPSGKYCGQ